jgi:uncharacterized protein (TIGR02284 family)
MDNNVTSTLNGLIETCTNGQEGFQLAAESVKDSGLKSTFTEFSQQRAQFAGELKSLVTSFGEEPAEGGTIAGALHRGWLNIKSVVTGGDDKAILDECERGEDVAKDAYRSALQETLPLNVSEVVRKQFDSILAAHQKIKSLRDSTGDTNTNTSAATGF